MITNLLKYLLGVDYDVFDDSILQIYITPFYQDEGPRSRTDNFIIFWKSAENF